MDSMSRHQSMREVKQADACREELAERIAWAVPEDGAVEPLDGLRLRRATAPLELKHGLSDPALCVVAQGAKELRLGDASYWYDPAHFLIATAELPITSRVAEAAPERPYLGLVFRLDPTLVSSVMVEAGHPAPPSQSTERAIAVSPLDANLLDAVVRLVRLLDAPAEARVLAPLVRREIVFRLLIGEQGGRVRHVAALGGSSQRIAKAIDRLRHDFAQPLRIDDLAHEIGMSVSSFHHHFKRVTNMSPLEFQKQMRLQEARRLMHGEGLDAANAGYRVGYNDASHFNREYKRQFGEPPRRDVERLRGAAMQSTSSEPLEGGKDPDRTSPQERVRGGPEWP
jgi:AraC-like DNA-binding protein